MKKFSEGFGKLSSVLAKISGFLILAIVIGVCAHVILRGFFNSGIQGIYEFVQYAMLTIVSLTLAENELSGGNVIVNFLLDKMKQRTANIVEIIMYLATIAGMIVVLIYQIRTTTQKYSSGGKTGLLGIPHWLLMTIVCIGLFFFILAFIVNVYKMIDNHKNIVNKKLTADEKAADMEIHSEF